MAKNLACEDTSSDEAEDDASSDSESCAGSDIEPTNSQNVKPVTKPARADVTPGTSQLKANATAPARVDVAHASSQLQANAQCINKTYADDILCRRVLLGRRRGKVGTFTFAEDDVQHLLNATQKYRSEMVKQHLETGKTPKITSHAVIQILVEWGGVYAELARRFQTEPSGKRRLADRIRHEIKKDLTVLGLLPPKSAQKYSAASPGDSG